MSKSKKVNIQQFDKAKLLVTLFNHASPAWFKNDGLPLEFAQGIIKQKTVFNKLHGRNIFLDIRADEFDADRYDRYNGKGKAKQAIRAIGEITN